MDNKHLVFVYGTLKRGQPNHYLLEQDEARFVAEAYVYDYKLVSLTSYPGLVPDPFSVVEGEIYEVGSSTMAKLDMLEGVPYLYTRQTVKIGNLDVYMYQYNQAYDELNHHGVMITPDYKREFVLYTWTNKGDCCE